jgi:hypothetical protein
MLKPSVGVWLNRKILHRKLLAPRPPDNGFWNKNVLFIWERDG